MLKKRAEDEQMKRMRIMMAGILAASLLLCGCGAMEAAEQDGTEDGKAVQAEDIQDENIVEAPQPVENVESKQEEISVDEEASQEMAEEVVQTQEAEQLAGGAFSILGDSISTFRKDTMFSSRNTVKSKSWGIPGGRLLLGIWSLPSM